MGKTVKIKIDIQLETEFPETQYDFVTGMTGEDVFLRGIANQIHSDLAIKNDPNTTVEQVVAYRSTGGNPFE